MSVGGMQSDGVHVAKRQLRDAARHFLSDLGFSEVAATIARDIDEDCGAHWSQNSLFRDIRIVPFLEPIADGGLKCTLCPFHGKATRDDHHLADKHRDHSFVQWIETVLSLTDAERRSLLSQPIGPETSNRDFYCVASMYLASTILLTRFSSNRSRECPVRSRFRLDCDSADINALFTRSFFVEGGTTVGESHTLRMRVYHCLSRLCFKENGKPGRMKDGAQHYKRYHPLETFMGYVLDNQIDLAVRSSYSDPPPPSLHSLPSPHSLTALKTQIRDKDAQIAALETQIRDKDVGIVAKLRRIMGLRASSDIDATNLEQTMQTLERYPIADLLEIKSERDRMREENRELREKVNSLQSEVLASREKIQSRDTIHKELCEDFESLLASRKEKDEAMVELHSASGIISNRAHYSVAALYRIMQSYSAIIHAVRTHLTPSGLDVDASKSAYNLLFTETSTLWSRLRISSAVRGSPDDVRRTSTGVLHGVLQTLNAVLNIIKDPKCKTMFEIIERIEQDDRKREPEQMRRLEHAVREILNDSAAIGVRKFVTLVFPQAIDIPDADDILDATTEETHQM